MCFTLSRPVLSDEEKQAKDCASVKKVLEKLVISPPFFFFFFSSFLKALAGGHPVIPPTSSAPESARDGTLLLVPAFHADVFANSVLIS